MKTVKIELTENQAIALFDILEQLLQSQYASKPQEVIIVYMMEKLTTGIRSRG